LVDVVEMGEDLLDRLHRRVAGDDLEDPAAQPVGLDDDVKNHFAVSSR